MENYIAIKPVRFDKNYAVGDLIPAAVIDRRTIKRLVESGKIAPASMGVEEHQSLFDMMKYIDEAVLNRLEEVFDIYCDDTEPPELQERITACKNVIAEIKGASQRSNDTPPSQEEPPKALEEEPTEHICQFCGKKCGSKSALTKHMKEHEEA